MKLKSLALLLVLILSAIQNTHAMYRSRTGIQTVKTTQRTRDFNWFRIPYYTIGLIIGLGLYDSPQKPAFLITEETAPINPKNLNITDVNAIRFALQHATESDKRSVAQQIAKRIMHYSTEEIINLLKHTRKRPHRIIINAIAAHITEFRTNDIIKILQENSTENTHFVLARALKNNIGFFLDYNQSYAHLKFAQSPAMHFAEMLKNVKPHYHSIIVKELINNIHLLSLRDFMAIKAASTKEQRMALDMALMMYNNASSLK